MQTIILRWNFLLVLMLGMSVSTTTYAEELVLKGTIRGLGGHDSGGEVTIHRLDNERYQLSLSEDFFLKNAPGPYLAFGNPRYDKSTQFSALHKVRGDQSYLLPKDFDPTSYSHFHIWCRPFDTALAVAELTP